MGAVVGAGIRGHRLDLCKIERIQASPTVRRPFLNRVFTETERAKRPTPAHMAGTRPAVASRRFLKGSDGLSSAGVYEGWLVN